jgi:2-amino-1-hydroxyethylphosphonate dioxygenase (glycine-forming)
LRKPSRLCVKKNYLEQMKKSNKAIISEIKYLFFKSGNDEYFGEKVSQFEHAAQAMMLAISEEESLEMQVAAFLHDIGHLIETDDDNTMEVYGRKDHEEAAKVWLAERGFSLKIQAVVQNHVPAKRYLCLKRPEYYAALSAASKKTMKFQGGVMTADEAQEYENQTYFEESLKLREWDDKAKVTNIELPSLEDCLEIVTKYLERKRVEV